MRALSLSMHKVASNPHANGDSKAGDQVGRLTRLLRPKRPFSQAYPVRKYSSLKFLRVSL